MPSHTAYELVLAAFGANLPFGASRSTVQRLGWRWFLAIHVPIPAIFLLRTSAGYSYWFIPWLFVAAVSGQILGARLFRTWRARRTIREQAAVTPATPPASLSHGRGVLASPAECAGLREELTTDSD